MLSNQIQQVQQKLSAIQQLANQMQQSQQRVQQMAQESSYAAQQLQRIQQISQECFSNLQNISGQQMYSPSPTYMTGQYGGYGQTANYSTGGANMGMMAGQGYPQQSNALFNQATMSPDTYQNAMQFAGAPQNYGAGASMQGGQQYGSTMGGQQYGAQMGGQQYGAQMGAQQYGTQMGSQQYQAGGQGFQARAQSPLSDIASMNADTYLASQNQLGKGSPSLQQIGQQAGVSSGALGSTSGSVSGAASNVGKTSMGTTSSLSDISTMDPSVYQSSQQQLAGTTSSLKQIGQQAGVTNTNKNYQ